jgi:hypothetical protein
MPRAATRNRHAVHTRGLRRSSAQQRQSDGKKEPTRARPLRRRSRRCRLLAHSPACRHGRDRTLLIPDWIPCFLICRWPARRHYGPLEAVPNPSQALNSFFSKPLVRSQQRSLAYRPIVMPSPKKCPALTPQRLDDLLRRLRVDVPKHSDHPLEHARGFWDVH